MSKTVDSLKPKRKDVLSRQIGNELVVYDTETHQAHCLDKTAAMIWRACDGTTTVIRLVGNVQKRVPQFDRASLLAGLVELQKAGLLTPGSFPDEETGSRSRREIIREVAKAAALALPAIVSILVPTPAMAASCFPLGHACTKNSDCCSGNCGVVGLGHICI